MEQFSGFLTCITLLPCSYFLYLVFGLCEIILNTSLGWTKSPKKGDDSKDKKPAPPAHKKMKTTEDHYAALDDSDEDKPVKAKTE